MFEINHTAIRDFCERWQIIEFALFGSVLRDDFTPESDIDVLVTFASHTRYGFRQLIAMQDELEILFGRKIDLIDKQSVTESANYIRHRMILSSAEVIYAA